MAWLRLVDGEGGLQWFSGNGEDTKGGGEPWRSSRVTQRSVGCYDSSRRRRGAKARVDLAGANSSSSGPYLKGFLYQLITDTEFFQSYLLVGFKS
jgi:hypothetical protein